jgi:hypothetical protein
MKTYCYHCNKPIETETPHEAGRSPIQVIYSYLGFLAFWTFFVVGIINVIKILT